MVSVRIRGIYSTALTSLLLSNGFRVVQPSATIRERFNLPEKTEDSPSPDLDIYDRLDRQGVNVVGDEDSLKVFAELLLSTLDDAVFRRRLSVYDIASSPNEQIYFRSALQERLAEAEASGSLRKIRLNVELPSLSKKILDGFRALMTPTLDGHHYYKACSGRISSLLEMAEKMLEKDCPRGEVEALFKETVEKEFPDEGSKISIEHVKISGKIFHLGPAEITEFDRKSGRVKLLRTFVKKGVYDGLKTRKDPGDYAVTEMKLGDWSFKTRYFSRDGRHKGTYVNINTPIEIYPAKIRYVDLEADLCVWPDGKIQKVDREKLEEMIIEGYVPEKLGQIVNAKIEENLNFLIPDAEKKQFLSRSA